MKLSEERKLRKQLEILYRDVEKLKYRLKDPNNNDAMDAFFLRHLKMAEMEILRIEDLIVSSNCLSYEAIQRILSDSIRDKNSNGVANGRDSGVETG